MITRKEVLRELGRLGLRSFSEIKQGCREYEDYVASFYGFKIIKRYEPKTSPVRLTRTISPPERKSSLHIVKAIFMAERAKVDSVGGDGGIN